MFCIVNSIDPLDLKEEDDNESNCSADSWELLDYQEAENRNLSSSKSADPCGEESAKPEKDENDAGSLQLDNPTGRADGGGKKKSNKKRGARKQRVSFAEIPDLVNEIATKPIEFKNTTSTTITTITSKQPKEKNATATLGSQKLTGNKATGDDGRPSQQKQQKQKANKLQQSNNLTTTSQTKTNKTTSSNKQEDNQGFTIEVVVVDDGGQQQSAVVEKAQAQPCARAPILNYAAALTAKLENKNSETPTPVKSTESKNNDVAGVTSPAANAGPATQSKVAKRNRPVSSSSWSSCDDEIIEEKSQDSKQTEVVEDEGQDGIEIDFMDLPSNNNDDGDSIVSSGFSDCDYGFGGLNDYVMRPKKAQAKRRRNTSSTSSSLLTSMAKRGNERFAEPAIKKNDRTAEAKELKAVPAVKQTNSSSRSIKPKKKKMTLSNPATCNQSDFLKKASEVVVESSKKSPPLDSKTIHTDKSMDIKAKLNNERQLMPPPRTVPQSATFGSDSSDIPDMDESWYLTPPPCFTGAAANKLCIISKPKAKEAVRENLLIEHPSVYIASTSKQVNQTPKKSTKELLIKQKAIVLKKVSNKQLPSSSKQIKEMKVEVKGGVSDKKTAKSWGNKFVVADWACNDQEDIDDDFDNCFPVLDKPVSKGKKNSSKQEKYKIVIKDKSKEAEKKANNKQGTGNSSEDYESDDFSIPSPSSLGENVSDDLRSLPSIEEQVEDTVGEPENQLPKRNRRNKSGSSEPKAPIKVEPIEPERQPGWQLKRKRSKRRPLINLAPIVSGPTKLSSMPRTKQQLHQQLACPQYEPAFGDIYYYPPDESSARSTPTFIDRIGSSIVANLTNLTSGFASSTGMNMQTRPPLGETTEKMNQTGLIAKSETSGLNLKVRKEMSKGYMNRQNNCKKVGNSNRRTDRRTKMHSTQNGVSVNRKVHTNFH